MRSTPTKAAVATAVTTAAIVFGGITPAFAAPAPALSADAEAAVSALRERLQSFEVEPKTQQILIKKFLAGRTLDADTDAAPASSEKRVVDGVEKTRYVYPDGSVAIGSVELKETDAQVDDLTSDVEDAAEGFTTASAEATGRSGGFVTASLASGNVGGGFVPISIKGCTSKVDKHGTHIFDNCEIAWDAATWSVSFTADYDYSVNGAAITSAKGVHFGGVGDFSGAEAEIIKLRVDNKGIAKAEGRVNQKIGLGPVATTRRVGVKLEVSAKFSGRKARESPFST